MKIRALIEVKCVANSHAAYQSAASEWVGPDASITYFDFDNQSDSSLADLALRLIEESEEVLILIGDTRPLGQLGSITHFLNVITRKHKHKVHVIYTAEDTRLAPFFKLLKSTSHPSTDSAHTAFKVWLKALQTGPHQPEKESDP